MTLPWILSQYFRLNLYILIASLTLAALTVLQSGMSFCCHTIFGSRKVKLCSQDELKLHYAILSIIMMALFADVIFPRSNGFSPILKVWSASSMATTAATARMSQISGVLSVAAPVGEIGLPLNWFAPGLALVSLFLVVMGCSFLVRDFLKFKTIVNSSYLIHKFGRARIYLSDAVAIPFSLRTWNSANVIVPARLLLRGQDLRIAIAHELQHHRQGDTIWVYLIWAMRGICFLNPAAHLWSSWISQLQEYACDETLVDQKGFDSRAYASCLVEVAATAMAGPRKPVGATGIAMISGRKQLKRRIEKMLFKPTVHSSRSIVFAIGFISSSLIFISAFASSGWVQDHRVTLAQAKAMELSARKTVSFPIVINDSVLTQLNRFMGTAEGRDFMRASMSRMKSYQSQLDASIKKYGAPAELLAIPIVESGYQNKSEIPNSNVKSAGIWQFIRSTAKNFGLKVTSQDDERLNVAANTDAAMRYLTSNYLRFGDWGLAAMAYNMGEENLQKGIDATGSRDAWQLIQKGYEGDRDYLAKVTATILILQNPSALD